MLVSLSVDKPERCNRVRDIIADPLGMEIPMPEKVTVYRFDIYDAKADKMVRSKRWATREAIVWAKVHILFWIPPER